MCFHLSCYLLLLLHICYPASPPIDLIQSLCMKPYCLNIVKNDWSPETYDPLVPWNCGAYIVFECFKWYKFVQTPKNKSFSVPVESILVPVCYAIVTEKRKNAWCGNHTKVDSNFFVIMLLYYRYHRCLRCLHVYVS